MIKGLRPKNGSICELYLRVTMFANYGSKRCGSGDWNHDSLDTIHHFYLASKNGEDTLNPHTNKLSQDLKKA